VRVHADEGVNPIFLPEIHTKTRRNSDVTTDYAQLALTDRNTLLAARLLRTSTHAAAITRGRHALLSRLLALLFERRTVRL